MTQENAGYEKRAHHKRTLNGADISYETICEDLPVTDENGEVLGTDFAYEYIREDVTDKQTRPVLFAWNGGPGSSAVWLHAGFLVLYRCLIYLTYFAYVCLLFWHQKNNKRQIPTYLMIGGFLCRHCL